MLYFAWSFIAFLFNSFHFCISSSKSPSFFFLILIKLFSHHFWVSTALL